MKAAVLKQLGSVPDYDSFGSPKVSEGEALMLVKAVALKNLDKLLASGKHYASYKQVPVVVGMDGVGVLEDGTKIYSKGKSGTLAEEAVVSKSDYVELPEGIDWDTAAALPNAAMGSYLPLKIKGALKEGDNILINGGTGVTGKLAIQLAKYYGASKVIVTGRIKGREAHLKSLGADELISTEQPDAPFIETLKQLDRETPIQIVIDYLWGKVTELVIDGLFRQGGKAPSCSTKIVTVGALAGDEIKLSSNNLRSGKTEIVGSGLGSYTPEQFSSFYKEVLPELFQLSVDGRLQLDLQKERLEDIATVWNKRTKGSRIVVEI